VVGEARGEPAAAIEALVDTACYPLLEPESATVRRAITEARAALAATGECTLRGFLRPEGVAACVAEVVPSMAGLAYRHARRHNAWFTDDDPPLAPDHPARARLETANWALTADRLAGTAIARIYEWPPLAAALAAILDVPALYPMADPLARLNVMGYGAGDGIGWHFDRARFTVTLLLQAAEAGGVFEYRPSLRTAEDPNYEGVGRVLEGRDPDVRRLALAPGDLNLFIGQNALHRVTPVEGGRMRLIAVLSFAERPGVTFTPADRRRFYGRAEAGDTGPGEWHP